MCETALFTVTVSTNLAFALSTMEHILTAIIFEAALSVTAEAMLIWVENVLHFVPILAFDFHRLVVTVVLGLRNHEFEMAAWFDI